MASSTTSTVRHIDLSHTIDDGMITYAGLPGPTICDFWSREESAARFADGVSFQIGRIDMVANTGTYIDTPFHRYADGADLAAVGLERLADLDGLVLNDMGQDRAIREDLFAGAIDEIKGKAILIRTGWDRHWRTDEYVSGRHPFLTKGAAELLRDAGAALVGIDTYNIDDTSDPERPVHSILLGAGIPIVEHMTNLGALPPRGFRFTAAAPKIVGMGSFPVRAFAVAEALR